MSVVKINRNEKIKELAYQCYKLGLRGGSFSEFEKRFNEEFDVLGL